MQMKTSDFDLARLLAPLKPAAFTRDCWEKSPRAVFRRRAGYFSGLLSLSDLDSIVCLSGSVSSENDMRLAKTENGKFESRPVPLGADGRPDIYALYRAHRDGYTLIVNRIDSRWRPVAALCRALEYELHHKASANLYFTPGGTQGFTPHFDTHDVFILQLEGSKTWRLYDTVELPLADDDRPVAKTGLGRPRSELTLKAGDVLYIPRGVVHEAVSLESSSLHLTVGLHVTRWLDLAQEALAHAAREDSRLREALPPGFLEPGTPATAMKVRLRDLLASLSRGNGAVKAVESLIERHMKNGTPAPDGHFSLLDGVRALNDDTLVERRNGMPCAAFRSAAEAGIRFPGNEVTGPFPIESALRFVAAKRRFKVGELPGPLSAEAKRVLVRRLIREGLLTLSPQRR